MASFRSPLGSFPDRRAWLAVLRQFIEHAFEVLGFAKVSVDRCEAYVSNVVERAQRLHHHLADRLGRNLALSLTLKFAHDLRDRLINALGLDGTLAQRDLHRPQQLVSVEGHTAAVALDHHELAQLHALECGKAKIAGETDAPAADD